MQPVTLEETARRLDRYQRVESWLFQTMGEWVGVVAEAEVKMALSVHAQEHAWHASLWQERLAGPRVAGDEGTVESDAFAPFATAVEDGPDRPTLERLVGLYRVLLPHTIITYWRHLFEASPVADGPVRRALKLVLNDEMEEWRQGEGLVQDLLVSPEDVSRAAAEQARLERFLLGSKPLRRQPLPL